MEAAPCEIFAPQGLRRIELRLPGFTPKQIEVDVRGTLFASVLFPRRIEIYQKLEAYSPAQSFINEAAEYAAWAFAGEPSEDYQIPLSLSEGIYRFGPEAADPVVRNSMEATLAASARFSSTRAALRDLLRAKTLLDNHGLSPSPLSLLDSAQDIIGFLEQNPGAAAWLVSTLSLEDSVVLLSSPWYAEAARQRPALIPNIEAPGGALIRTGGLSFRMVSGGQNFLGNNFPLGTNVETFYISETVISAAAWEVFLQSEPRWRRENMEILLAEGLVSEGYLEAVSGAPAEGVLGISWYAANAFCRWLNANFLPVSFQYGLQGTWEIRLPTEAEWEYAARVMAYGYSNPLDFGRFWEWCEDSFAPLVFIPAQTAAVEALGSPERSVRGGSWINPPGTVGVETRASLPPSFSSPFVSFRPVLAPIRNNP
jgi:formylglycine-generating enzyme required for sulfatase activity